MTPQSSSCFLLRTQRRRWCHDVAAQRRPPPHRPLPCSSYRPSRSMELWRWAARSLAPARSALDLDRRGCRLFSEAANSASASSVPLGPATHPQRRIAFDSWTQTSACSHSSCLGKLPWLGRARNGPLPTLGSSSHRNLLARASLIQMAGNRPINIPVDPRSCGRRHPQHTH